MLEVWREVCRHIEIGDSVARLAPILGKRLPANALLVRHIDLTRSALETVAGGSLGEPIERLRTRSECSTEELDRILHWCRQGRILSETARQVQHDLPGLLPSGLDGRIIAGPLNTEEGPAGVLVLTGKPSARFDSEHQQLVQALLEPLTIAIENDRRVRELTTLREAVEADNRSLLSRLGRPDISDAIVGAESGLKEVMDQVELVARSDVPVLILGETGSGKEVVARAIHSRSPRVGKPFLRVNCGAIPPELIDSELFGHERGSFTGAVGSRKGWFERADGGTLLLDECGELPFAVQIRLLRILQDGTFERVGGERQLTVDVRIIAATHRNLREMIKDGRFREDLWYRIAVFPVHLPPLRDRREDIPALASHFALRSAQRLGLIPQVPTPDDIRLLLTYSWPGNIRELKAVIERAAILGNGRSLEVAQAIGVATPRGGPSPDVEPRSIHAARVLDDESVSLETAMLQHIESALTQTRGRIEGPHGAAALLKINPHTLRGRMRKLGIDWRRFRTPESRPR